MIILQINTVCGIGSTGRIAVDLSRTMTKYQIDNNIIYGHLKSEYDLSEKIGNIVNTRIHQIHTRFFGLHGYASFLNTKKIIKKIDEINPDLIHIHNLHGFYINIIILFKYLAKKNISIVWTLHDCWPFTGHCSHFDFVDCHKWEKGCYKCPQKKSYPVSYFFDRSKKQWIDKKNIINSIQKIYFISPSQWLVKLFEQSFLNKYPISVINNGVDLDKFKHTKSKFKEKNNLIGKFIVLGIASSWGERKGLKYFLKLSEVFNQEFQIVLVGLSKEQIKKIPKNIIAIEKTNSVEELAEIYSSSDVFVNPTLEDNFPTVNLEALACGTPVVTFKTGGSSEAIDEDCGIVVEKGNFDELLLAIISIKNKPILREVCMKKALDYDKNKKYLEYIKLYKDICGGKI